MTLSSLRDWFPRRPPAPSGKAGAGDPPPAALAGAAPASDWPDERLALADALWGEGFTLPGGEEEVLRLAKPLGLSSACSVLLLGCGTGGAARTLAERLGAWVSGFDSDPALVAAATRHCFGAGLGKRAKIEVWDPAAPRFPSRYYHHALALEPLRHGEAATILPALAGALRPGCNLVLTEMVAGAGEDATLADWLRVERRAMPPTAEAVTRALEKLGFEIRVSEDVTQRHVHFTVRAWRELVRAMGAERPTPARAAPLVREAEIWLRRARLMRAGRLRLMRWHAMGCEVGTPSA